MKVNLDPSRFVHLFVLLGFTGVVATFLQSYLDWSPMAAYGVACTVVVQCSEALMSVLEAGPEGPEKNTVEETPHKSTQGNPKKKSRKAASSRVKNE